MKLLLIFLSAIMTFTVQDMRTVSMEGTWPYDTEAHYACTYQKGQVRAGDTATLNLTGLDGITVEKIEVYVKSNKNQGSGTFTVFKNGQAIATKAGSLKDWTGAFDNENYHAVTLLSTKTNGVNDLVIRLIGSVNSLHIEKYAIHWSQSTTTYNVTLMHGNEVLQTENVTSLQLPLLQDERHWQFLGWTSEHFYQRTVAPQTIHTGLFTPNADITLYACYQYTPDFEESIVTDLHSGVYLYANLSTGMALSDAVVNGIAGAEIIDMNDHNQWYEITFDTDSTATIKLMYVYGNVYVGYSGTQLADKPTKWKVYHEGEKTAFYHEYNNHTYVLWPGNWNETYEIDCTQAVMANDVSQTTTVLVAVETLLDGPIYTCYPECELGIEQITGERLMVSGEWIIPFGNYELIIRDGKKHLRLR